MVSNLLELSLTVYSGFRGNQVLFSNMINSGFIRKIELAAFMDEDQLRYTAVFSKDNLSLIKQFSEENLNVSPSQARDEDAWGFEVSPHEEAQLNEQILRRCLEKLGIVDSSFLT